MVNKLPLVSIGMPVRNGEKHIRRALDSLLAQKYENFELIVSDNASTDKTRFICEEYARRDPRIRCYRNTANIGALPNFQRVLELAEGDFFMWAAADDYFLPPLVAELLNKLDHHYDAAVAMCAVKRVREDQTVKDIVDYSGKADPSKMSHFELAMALAAGKPYHLYIYGLYRTEFLRKAFRNFPGVAGGDRLFVCQIALATKFQYVNKMLYIRQVHRTPIAERFKGDAVGKMWRDFFGREKTALAIGPYLWKSGLIPVHRKLYIPPIVFRLCLRMLRSRMRYPLKSVRKPLRYAVRRISQIIDVYRNRTNR